MKVTAKNLIATFRLEPAEAKALAETIREASSPRDVEAALEAADKAIGGYGTESIRGNGWRPYWMDARASYVNTGDTYSSTILYDVGRDRFAITSYGSWIEFR